MVRRNDIMVAGMWPQWASLLDKSVTEFPYTSNELSPILIKYRAKEEMRKLIANHPNGLDGFTGDMTPTKPSNSDHVIGNAAGTV